MNFAIVIFDIHCQTEGKKIYFLRWEFSKSIQETYLYNYTFKNINNGLSKLQLDTGVDTGDV